MVLVGSENHGPSDVGVDSTRFCFSCGGLDGWIWFAHMKSSCCIILVFFFLLLLLLV
jgi:hypothetical protein